MLGTQEKTVSEIAAGSLAAVRVFERLGIDYCCGGKRPLAEACREKGYDPAAVLNELDSAAAAGTAPSRDWNQAPLKELVEHIVTTHHAYLNRELAPLSARIEKVYKIYNEKYGPTLTGLPAVFFGLRSELEMHMRKEEMILFPAIAAYEVAVEAGSPLPQTPFGTVANPIHMMEAEHDGAGNALADIRRITANYAVPEYACVTYRSLMAGLQELEQDLHLHIHLENNILFPRAITLENSGR
ncbi:MAG: iron-sulfur cluster repair di-iron protein [Acidobacteriales bacterium]|nr:iron-sulfur cluster repair di-iron protein [Terriglobales bacterium]